MFLETKDIEKETCEVNAAPMMEKKQGHKWWHLRNVKLFQSRLAGWSIKRNPCEI